MPPAAPREPGPRGRSGIINAQARQDLAGLCVRGGEGGIRTPVGVSPEAVFETAAFSRSATSPDGHPLRGGRETILRP